MFNIAKKKIGRETFWDSVKFTWDSTFVDALGPRDAIEIKPKSNTEDVYSKPSKLDIKRVRCEHGILFYQITHGMTLQTSEYDLIIDFCVHSASLSTSYKNSNIIMSW